MSQQNQSDFSAANAIKWWGKSSLFFLILVIVLVPAAFVFFWMVSSSFKPAVDIYAIPPKWFNFAPTLKHYITAFTTTPFLQYLLNSTIVAFGSSLIGLAIGLPAAYSIARYRQTKLGFVLLTSRIMPGVGYLVPLFILFMKLHMVGSYSALILSHLVVTFPLTVYMMVGFFEDLPRDLFDAAEVDGCTRIGTFLRIALPLTRPGVVTAGILAFIFSWNDFKMALILSNSQTRTLPVAVFNFMTEASMNWGAMMAYATIITIPVIILTLLVQRHIVTGLTLGGVK